METHAHHLHKAPGSGWKHYLFEFLMLFLAVTLGFFVENLREHNLDRQREGEFMTSLLDDLQKDKVILKNIISKGTIPVAYNDSLSTELQKTPLQGREKRIYHFLLLYTTLIDFTYHDRTISQLKYSGGFRLVRNKEVSDALLDYDIYMRQSVAYAENWFTSSIVSTDININYHIYELYRVQKFQDSALAHMIEPAKVAYPPDLKLLTYDPNEIKHTLNSMSYVRITDETKYERAKASLKMNEDLSKLIREQYHIE
ncbi:MAG TPA: hypothetical protein VKR32_14395 [Puia sp.]|nr:hypothetical protein [Puia sp.]